MDGVPVNIRPFQPPPGSDTDFGAEIRGVELEKLTGL